MSCAKVYPIKAYELMSGTNKRPALQLKGFVMQEWCRHRRHPTCILPGAVVTWATGVTVTK